MVLDKFILIAKSAPSYQNYCCITNYKGPRKEIDHFNYVVNMDHIPNLRFGHDHQGVLSFSRHKLIH